MKGECDWQPCTEYSSRWERDGWKDGRRSRRHPGRVAALRLCLVCVPLPWLSSCARGRQLSALCFFHHLLTRLPFSVMAASCDARAHAGFLKALIVWHLPVLSECGWSEGSGAGAARCAGLASSLTACGFSRRSWSVGALQRH
ncbi:hypothetical protein BKA81DRAFT_135583 [Phyllosticta paracitricarpa]